MSKKFIVDANVDCSPTDKEYPKYFMDDLRGKKAMKIVIGGTTYRAEVKGKAPILDLVLEMARAGKLESFDDQKVDDHENFLRGRIIDRLKGLPGECDDLHIFALAHISGCTNIITKESRMASCRDKIRNELGHDVVPAIRVIRNSVGYADCW